jgi:hypothetical protein
MRLHLQLSASARYISLCAYTYYALSASTRVVVASIEDTLVVYAVVLIYTVHYIYIYIYIFTLYIYIIYNVIYIDRQTDRQNLAPVSCVACEKCDTHAAPNVPEVRTNTQQ